MDAGAPKNSHLIPYDVETIFSDFRGRRAAIIRALTTDFDEFFQRCDPNSEELSLYGFPNETWDVRLPKGVPPVIPQPVLGINIARDDTPNNWLSLIAAHSDSWLLSLAFFFGARVRLNKSDRSRLFDTINDLPTIFETVTEALAKQTKNLSTSNHTSSSSKSNSSAERGLNIRAMEEDKQNDDVMCGGCNTNTGGFWIRCDECETWYHGTCVKVTRELAAILEKYKCPPCSRKIIQS